MFGKGRQLIDQEQNTNINQNEQPPQQQNEQNNQI